MTSRAESKLEKVRADRDRLLAAGSHYEALQLVKTLASRAAARKQWQQATHMLQDGAETMAKAGQVNAASELGLLLIDQWNKAKQTCGAEQINSVLSISSAFPSSEAGSDAAASLLKAAIRWSNGHPSFHLTLARLLRSPPLSDRAAAHQHYVRAGGGSDPAQGAPPDLSQPSTSQPQPLPAAEYVECAENVIEWCELGGGMPSELDLFVVRAVLQLLCMQDLRGADAVVRYVTERLRPKLTSEPLIHFASFLIELCTRGGASNTSSSSNSSPGDNDGPLQLFDLLRHKYSLALSRDPHLSAYLDKIAELYWGRPAPKGLLDSLLGGLTDNANTSSASGSNSTNSVSSSGSAASSSQMPSSHDASTDSSMATELQVD